MGDMILAVSSISFHYPVGFVCFVRRPGAAHGGSQAAPWYNCHDGDLKKLP